MRSAIGGLTVSGCFAAGTTAGGALSGALAAVVNGLLGWISEPVRLGIAACVGAALVVYDLAAPHVRLPQASRQIPEHVFANDQRWAAVRFGFEYGTALRTYVTSAAPYVLMVAAVALPLEVSQCVLIGAAFGFGRSLSVFQYSFRRRHNWQDAVKRQSRLLERAGSVSVYVSLLSAAATG